MLKYKTAMRALIASLSLGLWFGVSSCDSSGSDPRHGNVGSRTSLTQIQTTSASQCNFRKTATLETMILCPPGFHTEYTFAVHIAADCKESKNLCNRCIGNAYPQSLPDGESWPNHTWSTFGNGPSEGPLSSGGKVMAYGDADGTAIYVTDGLPPASSATCFREAQSGQLATHVSGWPIGLFPETYSSPLSPTVLPISERAIAVDTKHAYLEMKRINENATYQKEQGTHSLKALTYNMGFLNTILASEPAYMLRLSYLERFFEDVLSSDTDVIFLQELWHQPENEIIAEVAKRYDYEVVTDYPSMNFPVGQWHGLQILVRRSSFVDSFYNKGFRPYSVMPTFEQIYRVLRGILFLEVITHDGKKILLATSHVSPYPYVSESNVRVQQATELAAFLEHHANGRILIFGGDVNSGPELMDLEDNDDKHDWLEDYKVYQQLYNLTRKANMVDAWIATNNGTDPGYTQNQRLNANSFDSKASNGEPQQRLDNIWLGYGDSLSPRPFVISSTLKFNHPLTDQNGNIIRDPNRKEPHSNSKGYDISEQGRNHRSNRNTPLFMSDHFGIEATISY